MADILYQGGDTPRLESVRLLARPASFRTLRRWMLAMAAVLLVLLFLPWQQNVQGLGEVTALRPDERPQQAVATVGGRVVEWFVEEGAVVKAGDPIVALAEVKESYLDPRALDRTGQQLRQKRLAVASKSDKADALARQRVALDSAWVFAIQKADNRIAQLTATLVAAQLEDSLATLQLERAQSLFAAGLRSLAELEAARQRAQRASALATEQRAALGTARAERSGVDADYREKIAKVEGDRSATLAEVAEGESDVAKLAMGVDNLAERQGLLVVRAPRDGIVVRALRGGTGEIVKDGEAVASVQPSTPQLAVALQVSARDVPLVRIGDKVRIEFEGWPAVQFSGWPSVAVGTFGGQVAVIDQFALPNGTYRVLVAADPAEEPWPTELRLGSGVRGWALLREVRVWFEIWRLVNGFPAALPKDAGSGSAASGASPKQSGDGSSKSEKP
ncbi:MAG: HlyD family secretion protein [Gemmatimonadaceae bacterium]